MLKIINGVSGGVFNRRIADYSEYESAVRSIIADVRERGDEALYEMAAKFDKAELSSLEVTSAEVDAAFDSVGAEFAGVLERAAANIFDFHRRQKREGFEYKRGGAVIGQRILPIGRAGIYVPGGTASYPSTVLMNAVPASIAGVKEIVMATPPLPDGSVKAEILVAARLAGVDRIFRIGGAGAIAAMAYGTSSVPAVDKITGPGNIYVALAKREVFGTVGIDMIAGPSEILIVADAAAEPRWVAADMLSQAEHDPLASAVLITDSRELAASVDRELELACAKLPRAGIAREALEKNGKIILTQSIEEAIRISNSIAPEHLELCVSEPYALLPSVEAAGSVFLGAYTPEAVGDYYAGPNHTLPTGGSARFFSPLSVDDFIVKSSYVCYDGEELKRAAGDIAAFAEREGLSAHARSVTARTGR